MQVTRNGSTEVVSFNKILTELKVITRSILSNYTNLTMKVIDQLFDNITTTN